MKTFGTLTWKLMPCLEYAMELDEYGFWHVVIIKNEYEWFNDDCARTRSCEIIGERCSCGVKFEWDYDEAYANADTCELPHNEEDCSFSDYMLDLHNTMYSNAI